MAATDKRIPQTGISVIGNHITLNYLLWLVAKDRIDPRYLNRWVKDRVCEEGMDYMKELAAVMLPDGEGKTLIRIIAEDNRSIRACFTEFFNQWGERVVDATWQKLIDALVETKKENLAVEIKNSLT